MSILGPDGRPISSATTDPYRDTLRGGWVESNALSADFTTLDWTNQYRLDTQTERRAARIAYFANPIIYGVVNLLVNFTVGSKLTYGEMADGGAEEQVSELFANNMLAMIARHYWLWHLLDGETALVFDKSVKKSQPGRVAMADVDKLSKDNVKANLFDVTRLRLDDANQVEQIYERGEFVWLSSNRFVNNHRGWPVIGPAVRPALAMINLLNSRLRQNDIQSRINAIYTKVVPPPDQRALGMTADQYIQNASARYGGIPKDGAVLTIGKMLNRNSQGGYDAISDEVNFVNYPGGGKDALDDVRSIRLLVCLVTGMPEHWLGEGGNVNRATSDNMNLPAVSTIQSHQEAMRFIFDSLMRHELVRRNGANKRYKVLEVKVRDNGLTRITNERRVPVTLLEFPWQFPNPEKFDLETIIKKVEVASKLALAGQPTLAAELGYDYAAESEVIQLTAKPQQDDTGGNNDNQTDTTKTADE